MMALRLRLRLRLRPLLRFLLVAVGITEPSDSSSGGQSAAATSAGAATRPNVLFILADDLGYANVGWHEPFVQTPHLDRLANEGIRLEGYYVQPICSVSIDPTTPTPPTHLTEARDDDAQAPRAPRS